MSPPLLFSSPQVTVRSFIAVFADLPSVPRLALSDAFTEVCYPNEELAMCFLGWRCSRKFSEFILIHPYNIAQQTDPIS
jgi:hypothetical protein